MASHEQDQLYVTNPTSEAFTVRWGGYPYSIGPGQKVIFPRFIAEHYAKHLADSILLKMEAAAKKKDNKDHRFLNSRSERPKVLKTILVGVYSYFRPDKSGTDENARIAAEIEMMNQKGKPEKVVDMGTAVDPTIGALDDDEDDEEEETIATDPQPLQPSPVPANAPLPGQTSIGDVITPEQPQKKTRTRPELFAEAKSLGLKPTRDMSNEQLEAMIKAF